MPETNSQSVRSEVLTVMFVDIVGYTKTTAQLNREVFSQLHDVFDRISKSIVRHYEGKIIKKIGDAFLITFRSPTNALLCGIELQKAFADYNKKNSTPIRIRVVVHTGEVLIRDRDIYGDAVNTAARMESITKPHDIVFSEASFLSMNKNEIPYTHIGYRKLPGLRFPIRLFKVKAKYDSILYDRKVKRRTARKFKLVIVLLLWLALVAVAGYLLLMYWLF